MKKIFLLIALLLTAVVYAQPVKVISVQTPQTIGGYTVNTLTTGLTNVKLKKLDNSVSVSGVEIGSTGYYKFDFSLAASTYPGNYKLYVNDVENTKAGIIQVGEFVDTYNSQTISGTKTFATAPVYSGSTFTSTNLINLSKAQSTIADSLNSMRAYNAATYSSLSGNNFFTGAQDFDQGATVRAPIVVDYADPELESNLNAYVTKGYVDAQVNTIAVAPFQESSNNVRVISNGTVETGKVYTNVYAAASYLTVSSTKPGTVTLMQGNTSTGFHYISTSGTIRDYITYAGQGVKVTWVIADESASLTKSATFKDMSIYFGVNAISGARSYNSMKFENCIIYSYNNTTFTNCEFYNVVMYYASTKQPTFSGCTLSNSSCNQEVVMSGSSNRIMGFEAATYTGFSMPTDPSLSP